MEKGSGTWYAKWCNEADVECRDPKVSKGSKPFAERGPGPVEGIPKAVGVLEKECLMSYGRPICCDNTS